MRALKIVVSILILSLVNGCTDESPFLSKAEAYELSNELNLNRDPFHKVKNFAAIINNDVYYFHRLDSVPKRLTNSPSAVKTNIKLSFDKKQIAYLNGAGHPVIIRTDNGQILQTLTQFSFIDQMDWAKDRLTLYMLSDNVVNFYGESIEIIQPVINHPWDEVKSFSMNSIGDQGYYKRNYGDFFKRLKYHSTVKGIDEEYLNFEGDLYDYIDFYDNNGNFLIGSYDAFQDGIGKVVCVQNYDFFPAYEWDAEPMNTPEFNAELEILLYGTMEENVHKIKGVYLGTSAYPSQGYYDILTNVVEDYPSTTPIYLDWVQ